MTKYKYLYSYTIGVNRQFLSFSIYVQSSVKLCIASRFLHRIFTEYLLGNCCAYLFDLSLLVRQLFSKPHRRCFGKDKENSKNNAVYDHQPRIFLVQERCHQIPTEDVRDRTAHSKQEWAEL